MKGSVDFIRFFSNNTVATQILFEPLIGGLSSGSIIINPAEASLFFGFTIKLQCLKTPPLGSFNTKFLSFLFSNKYFDCSNIVSPSNLISPATITSPISPQQ